MMDIGICFKLKNKMMDIIKLIFDKLSQYNFLTNILPGTVLCIILKNLVGYDLIPTDYYQAGVTDTLSHRKSSIVWIKKQKNHAYTYGNGCNSKGNYISAPYMGNALHTDTKTSVKDIYPEIKKYMPPSIKKSYSGEFPNITTTTNHSQEIVDMCKKLCYPNGIWKKC